MGGISRVPFFFSLSPLAATVTGIPAHGFPSDPAKPHAMPMQRNSNRWANTSSFGRKAIHSSRPQTHV